MKLDREFSIAQVAMLSGVDQNVLRNWMASGLFGPVRRGASRGRGRTLVFDTRSLMIVCLLRTLKRKGATLQYAGPLAHFLAKQTPKEIDQAAADDMVLVYAGAALPPCFRRKDEALEYRGDFPELGFKASVRELWQKIADGLEFHDQTLATSLN